MNLFRTTAPTVTPDASSDARPSAPSESARPWLARSARRSLSGQYGITPPPAARAITSRDLSEALSHDRFELVAQVIRPLAAPCEIPLYELLLRLRGRDGTLIQPGAFLPVAERVGMIGEIDRWVARQAIDLLAEHHRASDPLRLGVNLSGSTLGDGTFLKGIEEHLAASRVPTNHLVFEITETAAVTNLARARAFTERLASLGCRLALDDFGTGFSSFSYLKNLPADYLKLDGEYVRNCAADDVDRTLISAAVLIARRLGKVTIAEYVEDAQIVEVLVDLGVDCGQGYYLGRPVPVSQLRTRTSSTRRMTRRAA